MYFIEYDTMYFLRNIITFLDALWHAYILRKMTNNVIKYILIYFIIFTYNIKRVPNEYIITHSSVGITNSYSHFYV